MLDRREGGDCEGGCCEKERSVKDQGRRSRGLVQSDLLSLSVPPSPRLRAGCPAGGRHRHGAAGVQ